MSLSLKAQELIYAKALNNILPEGGNIVSRSIKADSLGNTYVTGHFSATADFDPGAGVVNLVSAGDQDVFVAKYNPFGQYVYAIAIAGTGSSDGFGIDVDHSGNVYVTGQFAGTADFNSGPGVANLTSAGSLDIFVASYDASGSYLYARVIGSLGSEAGRDIAVDAAGYTYITGGFGGTGLVGTVDFDPGAGEAFLTNISVYDDVFIARYDPYGNFVYAKSINSRIDAGLSIAVDGVGNAYITGRIGQPTLSIPISDIFIAAYDPAGNRMYLRTAGGTGSDEGHSIAVDGSGNVYVTGFRDDGNNIFFAKYDASGNQVYTSTLVGSGTSSGSGNGITVDGAGTAYITGHFTGAVDFYPGAGTATLTSAGTTDIFVAVYDPLGGYERAMAMGGVGGDFGYGIAVNGSGNMFIAGAFNRTADFDPGPGTFPLRIGGGTNGFICNLDNMGDLVWASQLGNHVKTGASDKGSAIAVDSVGNTYITGHFSGAVDFDPGPGDATLASESSAGGYIAKYDASGNYVYAKAIGASNVNAIAVDRSGNVCITGAYNGTVDFDPGPGVASVKSTAFWDAYVAKYDASGNYVYAIGLGANDEEHGYGIAVDGLGNVHVIGYLFGAIDFDPGPGVATLNMRGTFIAGYDAAGNYVYARALQSSGVIVAKGIALDSSGNVFITGHFTGTADFDLGPGVANRTSTANTDMFIARYDAAGNFVYASSWGGAGNDFSNGIAVDGSGRASITGSLGVLPSTDPASSIVVATFDASGNNVYSRVLGSTISSAGFGVTVDGQGNTLITGAFSETVDFDPGPATANLTSVGNTDIFVARYDDAGNYVQAKSMGGAAGDAGYGIATEGSGSVYVTGSFGETADFNRGGGAPSLLTATTFNDVFIAKYGPSGPLPVELVSFTAQVATNREAVQVNWSTAVENNNDYFQIERSGDGVQYESIGRKEGCVSCTGLQQYEWIDKRPLTGLSYYRLRQVDHDGRFSFSPVVRVQVSAGNATTIRVIPTTTTGAFELRITNPVGNEVVLQLLTASAKLISQQTIFLRQGDNRVHYNIGNYSAGVYYLRVIDKASGTASTTTVIRK